MSNKAKGSKAERELYDLFVANNFRAVRVAGSGMMENTACDLIAGNATKKFAIECKTSKEKKRYVDKQQMSDLKEFAAKFGFPPLVAVKFNRQKWWFIEPGQLEDTGKHLAISLEEIQKIGISFDYLIKQ